MLVMLTINLEEGSMLTYKRNDLLPDEKRYITLRVSTKGLRIIDKKIFRKVVNELKAKGKSI